MGLAERVRDLAVRELRVPGALHCSDHRGDLLIRQLLFLEVRRDVSR